MFFREKKSPTGKALQLVESYRNFEGQPRHTVVISLGNASIHQEERKVIAKAIENHYYYSQTELFCDYSESAQKWINEIIRRIDLQGRWEPLQRSRLLRKEFEQTDGDEVSSIDGVLVDQVGHTTSTVLGPLLAGLHIWKQLKIDECLNGLGFNRSQIKAATVSILNRLAEPLNEHAMKEWLIGTSLPELVGEDILQAGKDRFYRVSDKLLKNQEEIEAHIRARQKNIFSLKRTVFLYDLTNFYFEGTAKKNPKAKKGRSKQKRHDCPLIVLGMVFDENGFQLGHQIFEGNKSDSTSLVEMVKKLQIVVKEEAEIFSVRKPTVIVDSGVGTDENLQLLRDNGFGYLINENRKKRSAYREEFLKDEDFKIIEGRGKKSRIRVKMIKDLSDEKERKKDDEDYKSDYLVLCKSDGRLKKELAIRSNAEDKFLEELERLNKRIKNGRIKDVIKIERSIGRKLALYPRVARFYTVKLEKTTDSSIKHRLVWSLNDEKYETDDDLLGCYVLRTDNQDLTAEQLWELYMTLTRAEDGFKALKSDLGLRPNHHQIETRVDAHVFNTALAYHLLQHILYTLKQKGDNRCWKTIKRILQTHCYTTIILPTKKEGIYKIRKAGIPDASQKAIYKKLGVEWKNLPVIKMNV